MPSEMGVTCRIEVRGSEAFGQSVFAFAGAQATPDTLCPDGSGVAAPRVARQGEAWWGRQDSNLRSHEAADLQSAPFATRDTPPSNSIRPAARVAADRVIEMTLITGRPETGARSGAFMGEGGPQSQPSGPPIWHTFADCRDLCSKQAIAAARFLFLTRFLHANRPPLRSKTLCKLPIIESRDTSLT